METPKELKKIKLPYGSIPYLAKKFKVCRTTVWQALQGGDSKSIKAIQIRDEALRLLRSFEKKFGVFAKQTLDKNEK